MSDPVRKVLNLHLAPLQMSGRVTLGPVPGTPEFDFEQRCKAQGVRYVPPGDPLRAAVAAAVDAAAAVDEPPPDTQPSGA